MDFSIDRFYQLNRKAIIWIILFVLIYELRNFFTLIFLTFIVGFFAIPVAHFLQRRLHLSRGFSIVSVYAVLFIGYVALYFLIIPGLIAQVSAMQGKLPSIKANLYKLRDDYIEKHQNMAKLIGIYTDPSRLREDDMLRSPRKFYEKLLADAEAVNPNPGRRIMELLPEETRAAIQDAAIRKAEPFLFDADTKQDTKIFDDINEMVLSRRDFFRFMDFADQNINENPKVKELRSHSHGELSQRETQRLNRLLLEMAYPDYVAKSEVTEDEVESMVDKGLQYIQGQLPQFAGHLFEFCVSSVVAIFFSFLIAYDYVRLTKEVQSLASSKLRDFYEEAGQPVVRFALSVGYGFQAIAVIALISTILVIPPLLILRIPSVALLAVITFLSSLLPVVGVGIQAGAIMLVALNENGAEAAIWGGAVVAVIHVFIGYVITPIIFGRQFKINLVAVLIILFIGNRLGGVWGMILGVPIANYLLRDVFKVPFIDEPSLAGAPEAVQLQPTDSLPATLPGNIPMGGDGS